MNVGNPPNSQIHVTFQFESWGYQSFPSPRNNFWILKGRTSALFQFKRSSINWPWTLLHSPIQNSAPSLNFYFSTWRLPNKYGYPKPLGFLSGYPILISQWPSHNAWMHRVGHLGEGPNWGVTPRQHWEPQWGMLLPGKDDEACMKLCKSWSYPIHGWFDVITKISNAFFLKLLCN